MAGGLRVVGAGLGRTGTASLKAALELLLGGPCYHMLEVFSRPDHIEQWHQASNGILPSWDGLFDGFVATVDWPSAAFWLPISEAFPDAVILHSTRADAATWWSSADATIFGVARAAAKPEGQLSHLTNPWGAMWLSIAQRTFTDRFDDAAESMAAYDRHNAEVLATAPSERLVRWQPGDGWEPICRALGLAVPDEPFPHVNRREDWGRRDRQA